MKNIIRNLKKTMFAFAFIAALMSTSIFAHSMIIEPVNDTSVKVYYDGGGFSDRTVVKLLDENDKELAQGNLDKDGVYTYDKSLPISKIVAEDGLGHHAEWIVADGFKEGLPKAPIIAVAVIIFGGVAIFYNKKNKKKSLDNNTQTK